VKATTGCSRQGRAGQTGRQPGGQKHATSCIDDAQRWVHKEGWVGASLHLNSIPMTQRAQVHDFLITAHFRAVIGGDFWT